MRPDQVPATRPTLPLPLWASLAIVVVLIAFTAIFARADDGQVPPPPSPNSPQVTVTPVPPVTPAASPIAPSPQTPAPTQALTAQPAPTQAIVLAIPSHLLAVQQTPQPAAAPILNAVVSSPSAAVSQVTGVVKPAGPLRRLVGNVGEKLERARWTHVLVPPTQAPVQQVQYLVTQQTVTQPAAATTVQVQTQAVTASPQAPRKGLFGCR